TININGGGSIILQGGSGSGSQNNASISSQGIAQAINFGSGGTLQITGGTNGVDNWSGIWSESGNTTISGSPNIILQGGASGGAPDQPNDASIHNKFGTLTIAANNVTLTGGAGFEANATFGGANVTVTANGILLKGGSRAR